MSAPIAGAARPPARDDSARFYFAVRGAFRLAAAPYFRLRVRGAERLPGSGPAIVVAPHRSWLDPPCVGAACGRAVHFLIVDKVYEKRWATWFYRRMGSIPVTQTGHGSIAALRGALRKLRDGSVVGVFPEGRVVAAGEEAPVHPGAALLALRSGAPVVPLGIAGTERAWPKGRRVPRPRSIRVVVGDPIEPPPPEGREALASLLARIERRLRELTAEAAGR